MARGERVDDRSKGAESPPRYAREHSLPDHAYIPGRGRPATRFEIPDGPEHGANAAASILADTRFRLGVDLFNHRYYYEAHEAWESIWLHLPRRDAAREQLQGLIQAAAALLKLDVDQPAPARTIWARGRARLVDAEGRPAKIALAPSLELAPLIATVDAATQSGVAPSSSPRLVLR